MKQFDSSIAAKSLSTEDIQSYGINGYLVLPNLINEDKLIPILNECMAAWQREKDEYNPKATWLKNSLLPDIHHRSSLVRRYYFDGPLVDVAEQLIGPNIKGATSQLTFKMRGNIKPFGWHQDNGYGQLEPTNAISTLTALDDADEKNGCLWLIPGSHKEGQVSVSDRLSVQAKLAERDLSIEIDNVETAIPVPLNAGDAVVLHCHLLHRSEGNMSVTRDRRLLFLRYADADAVEVYNDNQPRLGPLLRGVSRFEGVAKYERELFNV